MRILDKETTRGVFPDPPTDKLPIDIIVLFSKTCDFKISALYKKATKQKKEK